MARQCQRQASKFKFHKLLELRSFQHTRSDCLDPMHVDQTFSVHWLIREYKEGSFPFGLAET